MKRKLVSLVAMMLVVGVMSAGAASASPGDILVYTGEGALDEGYTNFGTAAGKTVQTLAVLPVDLSPFDCVVLPINGTSGAAFSGATTTALNTYVNNGGRIIALAEHSGFAGSIATMNGLATALGADLSVVSAVIDSGFHTTTNIDASPFTAGVTSIRYAATSEVAVAVGPNAHSLVRSQGGTTFIGVDQIGSGVFVLSGDSNVFSDNSENGYTSHSNGQLVANICDQAAFWSDDLEFETELDGSQENPPTASEGEGEAEFELEGNSIQFELEWEDLTTSTFAAHIHCGSAGVNGPVGVTLFVGSMGTEGEVEGSFSAPDAGNGCGWASLGAVVAAMTSGNAYVNVHTPMFPGGEIRGQIEED